MTEFLQDIAPTTISLIITGLVSLAIGIYLEKFKNRLTFIKYNILFQPLATSNQNEYWGNIEVFYNGLKTNHLNFMTIILENDSNKDYQDIFIDIWVDKNSFIKGQNGFYVDSGKTIPLEKNHYNGLVEVLKQNTENIEKQKEDPNHITPVKLQNDIEYYQTNSKFYLPVFNRKSEIKFNILAENDNGQQPNIGIDVKHKGLKLIKENDKYDEDKKLGIGMITYGLIVFVLTTFMLSYYFPESLKPIVILGIVGFLNLIFGLFIYRFFQFIKNYLK
ncbi:hypothetical protein Q4566_16955 [Tamlana sp. 2_MG-2023]|uniref:hypothetical protein n=1 Tax=unclassified Tamlana TaxID=2614803 RepID=UPI0026E38A58|nr:MULTISPECIES: hypothetical protein [unclassified Tamlana]MDO6761896.1 hypothetical protein [Tamlana sp. 2_MG-2023]MDO6792655.1 hypothetical protein [Tamlana sp. 1_MG-2023]